MTNRNVTLRELFNVGSSKRVLKSQWKTEGVPFYRGREITRLAADGSVDNDLFISERDYADYAAKSGVPSPGDIVITAIGTIGNSYIVREGDKFYFKDASVLWLKKAAEVSSEFINLWLKSPQFFGQLEKGNGATVDTLTIKKLRSVLVNLPPLPEQHRIVAILDEAFAAIATATANAERNLANARELFESYLSAIFLSFSDPKKKVPLSQLAIDITDGDHQPPPKSKKGIPFITISNIDKVHRTIDFSSTFKVSESYHAQLKPKRKPRRGDLLYTVTGSFGIPVIVDTDRAFCFQRHIGLIRPKENVSPRWLYYLLLTPELRLQAESSATGTAQKTVSLRALRMFSVPEISMPDQNRIVEILDKLTKTTTSLVEKYERKSAALTELKQSVLHKAFAGELTANTNAADRTLSEVGL